MAGPEHDGARRFPTTNWSLVGHAGNQDDSDRSEALAELLEQYWPALRAHLVIRKRIESHAADDLVQGFIHEKVLERNLLGTADNERGRFRSLLLTSLDNYVASQQKRASAKKRTADRAECLDLQDERAQGQHIPPDRAFDVAWAQQLVINTTQRMKSECDEAGREDLWVLLECRVLAPTLEGAEPIGYDTIVERFGFQSPSQASNALITAKRMFARLLRGAIAEYAQDDADVDEELRDLERILSLPRS